MTGTKRRSPTNKEFKKNFENFASKRMKKGHLNDSQERKSGDNTLEEGILVRIHRKKLYKNGWEVKVGTGKDAKTYMCSYDNGVVDIPDSTETKQYYIPKKKIKVEVSIDKKTKIYKITKIKTQSKNTATLYKKLLKISTNNDENSSEKSKTSLEISDNSINIKSNNVTITDEDDNEIDLIESNKKLNKVEEDHEETKTKLKTVSEESTETKEKIELLLNRIEILETKLNEKENENSEDDSSENSDSEGE